MLLYLQFFNNFFSFLFNRKILTFLLCSLPYVSHSKLAQDQVWNKNLWTKNGKNPLGSIISCNQYFKVKSKDNKEECCPGHGAYIVKDKNTNKKLYKLNYTAASESTTYTFNKYSSPKWEKIKKNQFCSEVVKYNLECKGCLD